jgi:hypothetical protein
MDYLICGQAHPSLRATAAETEVESNSLSDIEKTSYKFDIS